MADIPIISTESVATAYAVEVNDDSQLANRYWIYAALFSIWCAWIAYATYAPPGFPSGFAYWVNGWHRFDAEWYFRIWNFGYGEDPRTLVFPPGFSWITGFVSSILKIPFDLAAFVVNIPSSFAAALLASEHLSRRFQVSWWLIFLSYLCFPATIYTFVPYSDCLFAALFWASISFADRPQELLTMREELTACAILFLAPFVRLTGFALAVWLLYRRWFVLAVFPTLMLIMLGNWLITRDMFYFLHAQRLFLMPGGWLLDGVRYHLHDLVKLPLGKRAQNPLFWLQVTVLPWISLILILIATAWLFRRKAGLLAVTLITVALFSRNQAYWRSVFRYDLPLVPLVVLPWLDWAKNRAPGFRGLLMQFSARSFLFFLLLIGFLLQWGFARRLHTGFWIF